MADKKTIALNERDSAAMLQQCGVNMVPCALLEKEDEAAFAAEMPFVPLLWRNGTVVHTRSIDGLTSSISNVFYSLGQLRFASEDS